MVKSLKRKKNRKKKIIVGIVVLSGIFIELFVLMIGNPIIFYHNCRWNHAVRTISKDTEKITFNEIAPFEWDSVYTFLPYVSRKEIWEVLGVRDKSITETVNEEMVQLIFVKEGKVTANICGYESGVGYSLEIPVKKNEWYRSIGYEEDLEFYVSVKQGGRRHLYCE